ncbi:DUF883 family protein [Delftia sp. NA_296.1]|uniref:DUF883 family protein n=1 Tax=Delftia sp. NA_296.1 TaxID=3415648 RepID=UPI0040465195
MSSNASDTSTSNDGNGSTGDRPEMINRMEEAAHASIHQAANAAAAQVQQVQESIQQATDSVHATSRQWRETCEEWTQCARTAVREKPLRSIATALAVGLLIARIAR